MPRRNWPGVSHRTLGSTAGPPKRRRKRRQWQAPQQARRSQDCSIRRLFSHSKVQKCGTRPAATPLAGAAYLEVRSLGGPTEDDSRCRRGRRPLSAAGHDSPMIGEYANRRKLRSPAISPSTSGSAANSHRQTRCPCCISDVRLHPLAGRLGCGTVLAPDAFGRPVTATGAHAAARKAIDSPGATV